MPPKVVGAKNSVKSRFLAILSAQEMREGQAQAETTALPSRRSQLVGSSPPAEYEAVFFVPTISACCALVQEAREKLLYNSNWKRRNVQRPRSD
jgi:hypothetical protein